MLHAYRNRALIIVLTVSVLIAAISIFTLSSRRITFISLTLPAAGSTDVTCKDLASKPQTADSWLDKTCMLHNICFDVEQSLPASQFGNPTGPVYLYQFANAQRSSHFFKSKNLKLNLGTYFVKSGLIKPVIIKTLPGPIPEDSVFTTDNTTVLLRCYNSDNFGHVLADCLYAVFQMQRIFGIPFNSSRVLSVGADVWFAHKEIKTYSKIFNPFFPNQQVEDQFLERDHWMRNQLKASKHNSTCPRYLCFRRLIAGSFHFSFNNVQGDFSNDWWNFRTSMIGAIGLRPASTTHPSRRVAISQRSGGAHWGRFALEYLSDESREMRIIRAKYDKYLAENVKRLRKIQARLPYHVVRIVSFSNMTIKEQIAYVQDLEVLMTFAGGGSLIAMFLPYGTSLLVELNPNLGQGIHVDEHFRATELNCTRERNDHCYPSEMRYWMNLDWISLCVALPSALSKVDALFAMAAGNQKTRKFSPSRSKEFAELCYDTNAVF